MTKYLVYITETRCHSVPVEAESFRDAREHVWGKFYNRVSPHMGASKITSIWRHEPVDEEVRYWDDETVRTVRTRGADGGWTEVEDIFDKENY